MLSYEVVAYVVAGVVVLGCLGVVGLVALVWAVRKLTLGARGAIKPEDATYVPSGIDAGVLAGLSERLAVLEGNYNSLRPLIADYATVQTRMSALEAHVPTVIDVTEKLTQNVLNADKRRTMQEKRAAAKDGEDETVGAAFASQQMGMAGAPAADPQLEKTTVNGRRPGVYGQGGSGGVR